MQSSDEGRWNGLEVDFGSCITPALHQEPPVSYQVQRYLLPTCT